MSDGIYKQITKKLNLAIAHKLIAQATTSMQGSTTLMWSIPCGTTNRQGLTEIYTILEFKYEISFLAEEWYHSSIRL